MIELYVNDKWGCYRHVLVSDSWPGIFKALDALTVRVVELVHYDRHRDCVQVYVRRHR